VMARGARALAWARIVAGTAALCAACAEVRPVASVAPTFERDVRPTLEARCGQCHGARRPAAGWSASRFTDVIACVPASTDGGVPDAGAWPSRLAAALARPDHQGLLDDAQRALIARWIAAGAPAARGAMHPPGFSDPRSADFHARSLRSQRWAPMLDATRAEACGRCHEGSPARPAGVTGAAGDAPSCTSCHEQPGGPLSCGTCHGDGERATPPRDPCLFPGTSPSAGAHEAHLRASPLHASPFTCETCHPSRTADFTGAHGDGVVDLAFDAERAGDGGTYDPATRTCTVGCHRQGGARPTPAWNELGPMRCNDCHSSPPANHPRGECVACHAEPDATGSSLRPGPLHLNARVDLGNGNGTCTACHGRTGDMDPWPDTGSHAAHRAPSGGAPVACATCHTVPTRTEDPSHFEAAPRAAVRLTGAAGARGARPMYDTTTRSCAEVACHGAGLAGTRADVPTWGDPSGVARRCGQCHGVPPAPPHTTRTDCASLICHGGEVALSPSGPVITAAGRALHQNGVIDYAGAGP